MQICISILKGTKIMESKAPNLEGVLQTKHFVAMRDRMWNPFTEYCPMMNANYKVHLQLAIITKYVKT
jgi:hypothetical protein